MNGSEPRVAAEPPLSRLRHCDRACDEFERQFQAGQSPRIEDFLGRAESADRSQLLAELLRLDLELRGGAGQPVVVDDYRRRFPEELAVVESAHASFAQRRPIGGALRSTVHFGAQSASTPTPPATDTAEPIPTKIGRYEIQRVLGRGGFAVVYLAHDPQLNRQVALKVPRLERFAAERDLQAFLAEARHAAALDHAGIVRVHDVQCDAANVYIVQEYIDGSDLATHARKARLTPRQCAELLVATADIVGYAHRQGYVHRDLKPANILIDSRGRPHVADFGLSLHESAQRDRAGELAGTCPYMSPEQVRREAHRLDGRSDLWSLRVILYELLTGRRPLCRGDA